MKKTVLLSLFALFIFGCAADIIIPKSGEFPGVYKGEYIVVTNYRTGSGSEITKKEIIALWTFTDYTFNCTADSVNEAYPPVTCDFYGNYEVQTNMTFKDLMSKRNMICDTSLFPIGDFTPRWVRIDGCNDSLYLEQEDITEHVLKLIKLEKQPEEE